MMTDWSECTIEEIQKDLNKLVAAMNEIEYKPIEPFFVTQDEYEEMIGCGVPERMFKDVRMRDKGLRPDSGIVFYVGCA